MPTFKAAAPSGNRATTSGMTTSPAGPEGNGPFSLLEKVRDPASTVITSSRGGPSSTTSI
ncbi:MAG: hypothetical protein GWO24_00285 [Akkermansiaceae bacterium]|nr:hypothetical protein [Akkermansiaceae bacterium]